MKIEFDCTPPTEAEELSLERAVVDEIERAFAQLTEEMNVEDVDETWRTFFHLGAQAMLEPRVKAELGRATQRLRVRKEARDFDAFYLKKQRHMTKFEAACLFVGAREPYPDGEEAARAAKNLLRRTAPHRKCKK